MFDANPTSASTFSTSDLGSKQEQQRAKRKRLRESKRDAQAAAPKKGQDFSDAESAQALEKLGLETLKQELVVRS